MNIYYLRCAMASTTCDDDDIDDDVHATQLGFFKPKSKIIVDILCNEICIVNHFAMQTTIRTTNIAIAILCIS